MENYSNIVISIITENGEQINLKSSKNDTKHLMAYQRLISTMGYDLFHLKDYINNRLSFTSITGFELSKYVAANGNIVFFHTDVNNAFMNRKEASIILPSSFNEIQRSRLLKMYSCLDDFNLYMGYVHYNHKRIGYERITKEKFEESILDYEVIMGDKDFFEDNVFLLIRNDGEVVILPRVKNEKNHCDAFKRLEKLVPGIFYGFNEEEQPKSGFEYSAFLGAVGDVIIWPTNINLPETLVVTMPKILSSNQVTKLKEFYFILNNHVVFVNIAGFKNKSLVRVIKDTISNSGEAEEAVKSIEEHIDNSKKIRGSYQKLETTKKLIKL